MTKRRILLKIEIFVLIFAVILGSVTFVMRNKNKGYLHLLFYLEDIVALHIHLDNHVDINSLHRDLILQHFYNVHLLNDPV